MQVKPPQTQYHPLDTVTEPSSLSLPQSNDLYSSEESTQQTAISQIFFETISQPQYWKIFLTTACCTFATLTLISCCNSKQN